MSVARLLMLCLLAGPGPALALLWPPPVPPAGTACTFETYSSVGEVKYSYTRRFGSGGEYTTRMPAAALHRAFELQMQRPLEIVRLDSTSRETQSGGLVFNYERYQAAARVDGRDVVITRSIHTETSCEGFPRAVSPGDTWSCRETLKDTWDVNPPVAALRTGTDTAKSVATYRYVHDVQVETPRTKEPVTVAVIEVSDEQGDRRHLYVDPALPWCSVQDQRLKGKYATNTERLVRVFQLPATADAPPTADRQLGILPLAWALLMGLGLILAVIIVIWFVTRKAKRPQ